jgi:hypothetical protein
MSRNDRDKRIVRTAVTMRETMPRAAFFLLRLCWPLDTYIAPQIKKCPARARRPILPQPSAVVLSAMMGLTTEFGTGSGDPHLHGHARARHLRKHFYVLFKGKVP